MCNKNTPQPPRWFPSPNDKSSSSNVPIVISHRTIWLDVNDAVVYPSFTINPYFFNRENVRRLQTSYEQGFGRPIGLQQQLARAEFLRNNFERGQRLGQGMQSLFFLAGMGMVVRDYWRGEAWRGTRRLAIRGLVTSFGVPTLFLLFINRYPYDFSYWVGRYDRGISGRGWLR